MRNFLIGAAALAFVAAVPVAAHAQASTGAGVAVGAGTGFLIAGPPGAIVGAFIGGGVGAAAEPRVYVAPAPLEYRPATTCWIDRFDRQVCHYN